MARIQYHTGNVVKPLPATSPGEVRVIAHVCNDIGAWGKGVSGALRVYPQPEAAFRLWSKGLGQSQGAFEGVQNQHCIDGMLGLSLPLGYMPCRYIRSVGAYRLGTAQLIEVRPDLWVANLVAQRSIRRSLSEPPAIRYEALAESLDQMFGILMRFHSARIHSPRFGAGLAGGDWATIETIFEASLLKWERYAHVYDLPVANTTAPHA